MVGKTPGDPGRNSLPDTPLEGAQEWGQYINGLAQERRKSSALAIELRLSCTKPSTACARKT